MKRKFCKPLLALACILMFAAAVCLIFMPGALGKVLAFPFSLIASGMQALSSLGRVGAGLAAGEALTFAAAGCVPAGAGDSVPSACMGMSSFIESSGLPATAFRPAS